MKIAILHEMLIKLGGAEKVVENLTKLFPDADLFTLIYDEKKVGNIFPKNKVHPSCRKLRSQKIYNITHKQRLSLICMKSSVESLDFSSYDRVIVSSSWFAHGLKTWPNTKTIIYYHAPGRYMWDWTHEYRREISMNTGLKWYIFWKLMLGLRIWDYEAAQKNDILLVNSKTTWERVKKYYRKDSQILYPPIETQRFAKKIPPIKTPFPKNNYYIILSALTEFKKIDIAIKAFTQFSHTNLIIIWDGEHKNILQNISWTSKNIFFAWAQYNENLVSLVQNSLGLIFPGEEDFGIVPIEVMAAGKPVFALNKWWLTETILEWSTGNFFDNIDGSDFIEKFEIFHKNNISGVYTATNCKKRAAEFDKEIFEEKILKYISS